MNFVFSAKGVRHIIKLFFEKHVFRSSASLSYFLVMSIFPLLICSQWLLGTLGEDILSFLENYAELIPENALSVLEDYLVYTGSQSKTLLSIGVLSAIYTGAASYRTLFGILHDIFEVHPRHSFLQFLMSFAWAILFLLFIYVSAVILLGGHWMIRLLTPFLEKIEMIQLLDLANLWNWFRFILLIVFSSIMLFFLYYAAQWYCPYHTAVLPGAVIASLLLTVSSSIFSWIISLSVNYSLIYGSLASIIILMFWLYIMSNIVILGSIINREISDQNSNPTMKVHKDVRRFIKGE